MTSTSTLTSSRFRQLSPPHAYHHIFTLSSSSACKSSHQLFPMLYQKFSSGPWHRKKFDRRIKSIYQAASSSGLELFIVRPFLSLARSYTFWGGSFVTVWHIAGCSVWQSRYLEQNGGNITTLSKFHSLLYILQTFFLSLSVYAVSSGLLSCAKLVGLYVSFSGLVSVA